MRREKVLCGNMSAEKYLDKIETADIIETVTINRNRVYLYRKSIEKTSRIVELDRERRRRKSRKTGSCGWKRQTGKQI